MGELPEKHSFHTSVSLRRVSPDLSASLSKNSHEKSCTGKLWSIHTVVVVPVIFFNFVEQNCSPNQLAISDQTLFRRSCRSDRDRSLPQCDFAIEVSRGEALRLKSDERYRSSSLCSALHAVHAISYQFLSQIFLHNFSSQFSHYFQCWCLCSLYEQSEVCSKRV